MKQSQWIRTGIVAALVVMASIVPAFAAGADEKSDELTRQLVQRIEQLEKKLAEMNKASETAAAAPAKAEAAPTPAVAEPAPPEPAPVADAPSVPPGEKAVYVERMGIRDDLDVTYGTQNSFLTWHGYLNFEYFDAQGGVGKFDNHEFYLATKARASEHLGFTAEFEYEHNPEKLILPIQAYADLTVVKPLTFRAGLWYSPIGMPRGYNLRGNRNRMIRQVAVTHDLLFENWADVGIAALGEFDNGFFYNVGLGNGMPNTMQPGDSWFDADGSLQDHTEDNNNNKALHSRAGYHSLNFFGGELNAALSYGNQKYDPANTKRMIFKASDLRYVHRSGWRVQAEYVDRSGDSNPVDLAKGMSADAKGWYVQTSKRWVFNKPWLRYLEPAIQVDSVDWNKHVVDSHDLLTTAVALVYSPVDNYLLKTEYDWVHERGNKIENNKIWFAVVMEF